MEKEPQVFKYERPEFEGVKKSMLMCNSDLMRVHAQVVKTGGENNLHTHTGEDAFWLVLSGAVKFYGEGDKVIAELKKHEGIMIPRGFMYWLATFLSRFPRWLSSWIRPSAMSRFVRRGIDRESSPAWTRFTIRAILGRRAKRSSPAGHGSTRAIIAWAPLKTGLLSWIRRV